MQVFFSLLSFSFTEGVAKDRLPSQLEWGIVGNLSGCEIGRRHCCFDRVSAPSLYVSVCVSAAGTWCVLGSVRLITFSKPEEGRCVLPLWVGRFLCVCMELYQGISEMKIVTLQLSASQSSWDCSDKGSCLSTGPPIHANTHMCLGVRFLSGDL